LYDSGTIGLRISGKRCQALSSTFAHHGVLAEAMHFLSKPFEVEALARQVRDVLDGEG